MQRDLDKWKVLCPQKCQRLFEGLHWPGYISVAFLSLAWLAPSRLLCTAMRKDLPCLRI